MKACSVRRLAIRGAASRPGRDPEGAAGPAAIGERAIEQRAPMASYSARAISSVDNPITETGHVAETLIRRIERWIH